MVHPGEEGDTGSEDEDDVELVQPQLTVIPKLVLDMQQDNIDVVLAGMDDLLLLLQNQDGRDNVKCSVGAGILLALVRVMGKWQKDEEIQTEACATLSYLSMYDTAGAYMFHFYHLGGVEALVNAMKLFPRNRRIILDGIYTLDNSMLQSSPMIQGTSPAEESLGTIIGRRFVKELGGIEIVLMAMEELSNISLVLKLCCRVLSRFSEEKEFRPHMWDAGAVPVLASVLEDNLENEDIKHAVFKLLKNMKK